MENEKRLIDANALLDKLIKTSRYFDVKFDIEEAPTVDAVEVVHGKWLTWKEQFPKTILNNTETLGVFCSVCKMYADNDFDYCPNCGAKMDGDKDSGLLFADMEEIIDA